jgi:hypothetical protein
MVCIANYNDKQEVIGCTREDGVSGGLEFLADCEALGFTITYKSQAELDAIALQAIEDANISDRKNNGEVYTLNGVDYKVSFMKDDADGMMQVSMAFQLGLTETVIYFENGTKMLIKNTEFEAFAIWFVGKRNSFFVGE